MNCTKQNTFFSSKIPWKDKSISKRHQTTFPLALAHFCQAFRTRMRLCARVIMNVYLMANVELDVPDGKALFDFQIHDLSHSLYLATPLCVSGAQAALPCEKTIRVKTNLRQHLSSIVLYMTWPSGGAVFNRWLGGGTAVGVWNTIKVLLKKAHHSAKMFICVLGRRENAFQTSCLISLIQCSWYRVSVLAMSCGIFEREGNDSAGCNKVRFRPYVCVTKITMVTISWFFGFLWWLSAHLSAALRNYHKISQ